MPDQADHLRHLMLGVRPPDGGTGPQLILVAGAKGGVGTTTVAVNLSVVMAQQGRRAVLVDGDLGKSGVAALCGDTGGATIADVLCGRRDIAEALRTGPAGVRLLVGAWATGHLTDCDAIAQQRLIAGLKALNEVDVVIIDAGCGLHRILERFWRSANNALLVTTTDDTAVMDAYAMVKTMAPHHRQVPLYAVMNRVVCYDGALDAHARLTQACRRFLSIEVPCMANIMDSEDVVAAARRQTAFVLDTPVCQATQTIEHLAQFFVLEECHEFPTKYSSPIRRTTDTKARCRPSVGWQNVTVTNGLRGGRERLAWHEATEEFSA
jgi:flagellar biosynthesis protein FlhG